MAIKFEELDFCSTPIGDLSLRRRRMPQFGDLDIYEVKLGEEFLMSSLFHQAEEQLATLGLNALNGENLSVVVGGLGLGHTAVSALRDARVDSLIVVEYLEPVIRWHKNHLLPLGKTLTQDSRCKIVSGDFFALAKNSEIGFNTESPAKKFDAILLDIDHSPTNLLSQTNKHFYTESGLKELSKHLNSNGVFALWSDTPDEGEFEGHLKKVFHSVEVHNIEFDNAINGSKSRNAIYIAKQGS